MDPEDDIAWTPWTQAAPAYGVAGTCAREDHEIYWDVYLTRVKDRFANMRLLRQLTPGLGLDESKALTDNLPARIRENLWVSDAKDIIEELAKIGSTAEKVETGGSFSP